MRVGALVICVGSRCLGRPEVLECPSTGLYAGVGLSAQLLLAVVVAAIVTWCLRSSQPADNGARRSLPAKRAHSPPPIRISAPTPAPPPRWLCCLPQSQPELPELPEPASADDADDFIDVVPPLNLPFLEATVESRPALPFPLLRVRTTGEGYGPPDVAMANGNQLIQFVLDFLATAQPFVVMYDFRTSRWPPMALCQLGIREADKAQKPWDAAVQGIVIIFDSTIVRAFLSFMIGVRSLTSVPTMSGLALTA